jgi:hypothetical protein
VTDETAPAPQQKPAGAPAATVTLRTQHPISDFHVPDHDVHISQYGTEVPADKLEAVKAAATASGIILYEVK